MSWDLVLAKYDLCLGQGLTACGSLHPALDGDTNPTHDLGAPPGKGQNCTGQKCTEHELVLLMFFVLKCLDDLL